MSQIERYERLRLLVKKVNRERKRQANQVDILCNDLVAAHREFMRRLNSVGFAARFYKDLLGVTELRTLLTRAGRLIREELPGAGIAFFLRQADGADLHVCDGEPIPGFQGRPADCFTPELVNNIYKSNQRCTVEDLFGMGLEGDRKDLNNLFLATIPLQDLGRSLGFVLAYRAAAHPLRTDELDKVGLIACGLSQAIRACGAALHSR
jgi:hypothetical protein